MFLLGWRRLIRRKPLMLMAVGILIATTLVVGCTPGNGPSAPIGDENTISFNVTGLAAGKTYYWRVIAVDDQNETSAPSETRSFTTFY
jgi:hypothetical protein